MRLSWNEIRARAAAFAKQWAGATREKSETQSFYNDFFEIFGVKRRSVARYEEQVERLDNTHGYIDLFWPGVLLVEQKSAGRSLKKAREQADSYFDALPEGERPRYQLLCDFQNFELLDRDEREETHFALPELPHNVEKFGFILGLERRSFEDQDPVNNDAAELVGALHDALEHSGYTGHDLERLLVRIVFCLFADDTGIFEPRDLFLDFLLDRTREDGSDLGGLLIQLFQVLNTHGDKRQTKLDEDLARFPHVNGDLFDGVLRTPAFDSEMRMQLIAASRFDWSKVSPAIFGSLFQSVMDPVERRQTGGHYTTEKNIMKVIGPLFLDNLRAEFERIRKRKSGRHAELRKFHERLGKLKFFDPACGCGNFLIIAYRELRKLEIEILRELTEQRELNVEILSRIDVDQFYGIEIKEFPVRIAETALWMMDHIMNNQLSLEFGQSFTRIPLEKSPTIHHADALETDWADVLPPGDCSYILGNPPFGGAKYQSNEQRAQVHRIAGLGGGGGTLDYVAAWFIKAGEYTQLPPPPRGHRSAPRVGFVASNSITQGEQVAQLWPLLFDRYGLEIAFAHRTFAWGSDARGKAHVHVVIIGLCQAGVAPKQRRLFSYSDVKGEPHESQVAVLSPYLFDAGSLSDPHSVVKSEARPVNGLPKLIIGSKPIDGGHYIFDDDERAAFLAEEPSAEKFMRPFVGAREYLHGNGRWILALHDARPTVLKKLPKIRKRMAAVRAYRSKSKSKPTQALAKTPTLYHVNVIPATPFLILPGVSSERRDYIPIGWMEPPTIPSNLAMVVLDGATKPLFGLLTSAMHMSWLRHIGGRLKSDYRYSAGLVYNTFPLPPDWERKADKLTPHAQAVLDARAAHPDATLANLYDPDLMPPNLRRAHQKLDRTVDRLYRRAAFHSDRERAEHLFALYEKTVTPITAANRRKRTRN